MEIHVVKNIDHKRAPAIVRSPNRYLQDREIEGNAELRRFDSRVKGSISVLNNIDNRLTGNAIGYIFPLPVGSDFQDKAKEKKRPGLGNNMDYLEFR